MISITVMFENCLFLLGVGQFVYVHSNSLRKWSGNITLLLHILLTPIDMQGKMVNNIKKKINKITEFGPSWFISIVIFHFLTVGASCLT